MKGNCQRLFNFESRQVEKIEIIKADLYDLIIQIAFHISEQKVNNVLQAMQLLTDNSVLTKTSNYDSDTASNFAQYLDINVLLPDKDLSISYFGDTCYTPSNMMSVDEFIEFIKMYKSKDVIAITETAYEVVRKYDKTKYRFNECEPNVTITISSVPSDTWKLIEDGLEHTITPERELLRVSLELNPKRANDPKFNFDNMINIFNYYGK